MTGVAATGFQVDLALLKQAVDELDRIAVGLEAELPHWSRARINDAVHDPGTDPVSVQLGSNMRTMAERAGMWLAEYAAQVRAAHAALQAQHAAYLQAEAAIAGGMRAWPACCMRSTLPWR